MARSPRLPRCRRKAPEVAESELKKPEQFRLIGKDVMRVEMPSKVNGTAQYSIDVQVPGMLYGAILRAPVEGAAPDKIDDTKAKAIAGVVQIVRLPYGVGVIAETPWAAFSAKDALNVTWTRTARRGASTATKALVDVCRCGARHVAADEAVGQGRAMRLPRCRPPLRPSTAEYRNDLVYHAQMEPLNAVASVSRRWRRLRVVVRRAVEDDRGDGRGRCARHRA